MGLFDRFRRRIEEAEEESGITAEEGSEEAANATKSRSINLKTQGIRSAKSHCSIIPTLIDARVTGSQ